MARKPSVDSTTRFHDNNLFLETRTVLIGSEENSIEHGESGVNGAMAERAIKNLHILDSINNEDIHIILTSYGGDVFYGMMIFDAIRKCKSKVIIEATGPVMSMASIILQAGDERILSPHSVVMIHHGYDAMNNHVKTIRSWVEFGKKYDKILNKIYLDKIREKHPDFKTSKLDHMMDFDSILLADEAVALGLADRVSEE